MGELKHEAYLEEITVHSQACAKLAGQTPIATPRFDSGNPVGKYLQ